MSDFTQLASHQLLTPLTISQWYLQLLQNKADSLKLSELNPYLKAIHEANVRMHEIVSLLLGVSTIENENFRPRLKPVDAGQMIEKQIGLVRERFKTVRCEILLKNLLQNHDKVFTDEHIFSRIIAIILSNGIKYNRSKVRKIMVRIKREKGFGYILTFKDNGIGIKRTEHSRIFDKFYRSQEAVLLEPDGNGLGLYFVRLALSKLRCTIKLESRKGKGAVFTIIVPSQTLQK
jgi:signal transduction histidine kinase